MSFDPARVLRTLAEHEVRYVLVGAAAAWLQANPTVTHDLALPALEATLRVLEERGEV